MSRITQHVSRTVLFWGLWLVGCAALGIFAGFAAVTSYFPADLRLAHWMQDVDAFGRVAAFTNALGDMPAVAVTTFLAVAAFAVFGRWLEAALVVLTLVPRFLRNLLAEVVARPRPSPELVEVRDDASGYGFPSGHVVGAVVFYGLLFVLAGLIPNRIARWLARGFCLFVVLATGPGRVYSGVHWPSDVLGGLLLGGLALALLLAAFYRWRARLPKWNIVRRRL